MLNTKNILLIIFSLIITAELLSNPFKSKEYEDNNVPVIRNTSGAIPEELIKIQMDFRTRMGELLLSIKNGESRGALFTLLLLGFLYGVAHAAGPGHRKTVLFSVFLSNKSRWWEPAFAGTLSAILHGFSGIALILLFKEVSRRVLSTKVDTVSKYMETISFSLLMILALLYFILELITLIKGGSHSGNNEKGSGKSYYYTVILTSLFPCPGAILVLILSLSQGILNAGILTVVFMSLGMGLTISITAYLGRFGRVGLFRVFKSREDLILKISSYLELIGYLFLLLFAAWMLLPIYSNYFTGI